MLQSMFSAGQGANLAPDLFSKSIGADSQSADGLLNQAYSMTPPHQQGLNKASIIGAIIAALIDHRHPGNAFAEGAMNAANLQNQNADRDYQAQQQGLIGKAGILNSRADETRKALQFGQEQDLKRYGINAGLQGKQATADASKYRTDSLAKARELATRLQASGKAGSIAANLIVNGSPLDKQHGYEMLRNAFQDLQLEDSDIDQAAQILNPKQQEQMAGAGLSNERKYVLGVESPFKTKLMGAQTNAANASAGFNTARTTTENQMRPGRVALIASQKGLTDARKSEVLKVTSLLDDKMSLDVAKAQAGIDNIQSLIQTRGMQVDASNTRQTQSNIRTGVHALSTQKNTLTNYVKELVKQYNKASDDQKKNIANEIADGRNQIADVQTKLDEFQNSLTSISQVPAKFNPANPNAPAGVDLSGLNTKYGQSAPPQARTVSGNTKTLKMAQDRADGLNLIKAHPDKAGLIRKRFQQTYGVPLG